ncbi:peptidase M16 [Luteitalea sp. TBR-22]|uniref:M16 family metallopeptidase n=1 Tax=Luteitalea sp. TBR-22 TaxID=2802971 RepID=UPI001AF2D889|nr:pitrilysin family protein [Luteitalea sp. TBR-22]BCS32750.1 peptidase M16 [Luteitalea sp. TBR-22]
MLVRPVAAAALAACVVAGAFVTPTQATSVRPPAFKFDDYTLPNGLRVILLEDHSTPIVHVTLWYHVGSKDEKPGRTGFAHLFEHMMFKGSRNVQPEAHTSYIASVGGQSNAYTTEDTTVFWQTVPAQYLPLTLWLEADRMASLRVEESTFKTEREVVKEERRQRVENQPYGRLSEIIYDKAFTTHPYKHPVIGSMADLEAASIDDVREFHRTYYRPDNALLVIAGDFDPAIARQLVEKEFSKVEKPTGTVPRNIPAEPARTRELRVTIEEDWPLPAVVVAYPITYDGNPDSYPLHIAAKVLSDGTSSRIYQRLVYKERLALSAFGQANLIEHPNLFYAVAIVAPGRTPEQVASALIEEMDKLVKEPISERELQRSKNQFARDYVLGRQTVQQKAGVLAHAVVLHKGDVGTADGEFDIFQKMTAADVQRVAKTYFTPQSRMVLTVMPRGQRSGGGQ